MAFFKYYSKRCMCLRNNGYDMNFSMQSEPREGMIKVLPKYGRF